MTPPKVLIADAISQRGVDELSRDGAIEAVVKIGLSEKELVDLILGFSGLVMLNHRLDLGVQPRSRYHGFASHGPASE